MNTNNGPRLISITAGVAELTKKIAELRLALALEREACAKVLRETRDYILNKAQRHDLYWRDSEQIVAQIDAIFSALPSPDLTEARKVMEDAK